VSFYVTKSTCDIYFKIAKKILRGVKETMIYLNDIVTRVNIIEHITKLREMSR